VETLVVDLTFVVQIRDFTLELYIDEDILGTPG
jgi:hypothetical protein